MKSKNHEICHDIICGGCDKKIGEVSQKLTCVLLTNRNISEEVIESCEGFVKIWSQSDDQIEI